MQCFAGKHFYERHSVGSVASNANMGQSDNEMIMNVTSYHPFVLRRLLQDDLRPGLKVESNYITRDNEA